MPTVFDLKGVSKSFRTRGSETLALQPTDLVVERGEFVALVGPSGCGKSTVLNIAAGLIAPTEGRILFSGKPLVRVNSDIGYRTLLAGHRWSRPVDLVQNDCGKFGHHP